MVTMAIISFTNYKRGQTRGGMGAVLRYTAQDWKTEFNGRQLVTGINCQPETVCGDFMTTKYLHHKTDGTMFYHMVQSFSKGADVDPAVAHSAAQKLAEYFAGHEVLVCTHTDREHIHSHFIINSVSFDTGKKLHIAKEQLQELRQRNDAVCMEFSLPVFVPNPNRQKSKHMTIGEYHTAARGQSKKLQLMNIINDCMRHAANREEFIALMESEGCKVRWEKSRQNITYTTPSGWQCRDRLLFGDKYLKENMEHEFEIRAELIHGRAHGEKSSPAYTTDGSGTDHTADAVRAASTGASCGGQLDDARVDGPHREPVTDAGGAEQLAAGVPAQTVREVDYIPDAGADGRTAEGGEAFGADDRTGWETEREAFLSSEVQTAQAATASPGVGLADSGHGGNGAGYGGVASALVQVGRRLEQSQSAAPVMDSTTMRHHTDSKTLRKEREKKIALGHKSDDHEDEETYTWQQTM
ncbi:relaxase/mobilization nuclease domain-containing protein [Lawsonibacter celer]|uniref:relaxase/mobilization nuclease domain-containing protein n=1 Tax=Lawsonibacter celer TaxID=2986526 RepID=UPI001FAB5264|nr:relaxase/mobilization nuclease domain-containing protein [Lawsonibacter celer]